MRGQRWIYVTVAVILALSSLYIARLRLSEIPDLAVGQSATPPALGQTPARSLVYEVDGPDGAPATASYLDATGDTQSLHTHLPWIFHTTSRKLTFPAGVTAAADRVDMSCRVLIDGVVRAVKHGASVVDCQVVVS